VPLTALEVERLLVLVVGLAAFLACRSPRGLAIGVVGATTAVSLWNLVTRWGEGDTGHEAQPVGYGNGIGILCAIGLLLAVGLALERRPWLLAAPPLAAALWLSDSKGAWLAAAVGAAALGVRTRRRLLVAVVVAGLALSIAAALATSQERRWYWEVAVEQVSDSPVLGTGAGTWPRTWHQDRSVTRTARDAHGDYVETLSELGPLGLALLLLALGAPLLAGARSPAVGAYAAFVVHVAVDWDLEQTAVALAGLACGAALLTTQEARRRRLRAGPALAALVAVAALAGWLGNVFESRAAAALRAGDAVAAAQEARRAARLAPWASEPWRLRGEAQRAAGDGDAAARSFREGLERDAGDPELWVALARVAQGEERRRALAGARRLNPLGVP
jgi:hypothetical protein